MSELYSIIQFYPRALRREGINVGVVVLSERLGAVRVKMSSNNELIRKHHGAASFDDVWLTSAKRSLSRRLQNIAPTLAALTEFVSKEAGQLIVLPPRSVAVEDIDRAVALLFNELVGEVELQRRPREHAQSLDDVFMPLFTGKLVEKVQSVTVPVLGKKIRGAYKYRNGALNYIKPQAFPASEEAAITTAGNLGLLGLMLSKHPVHDHDETVQQRLIIVAQIKQHLTERIKTVLKDCSVRLVLAGEVTGFVDEVRESAHPLR
jgi:hypothetical protein